MRVVVPSSYVLEIFIWVQWAKIMKLNLTSYDGARWQGQHQYFVNIVSLYILSRIKPKHISYMIFLEYYLSALSMSLKSIHARLLHTHRCYPIYYYTICETQLQFKLLARRYLSSRKTVSTISIWSTYTLRTTHTHKC